MKIGVITSNQPRHINLIENLAKVSQQLRVLIESDRVYPGLVSNWSNLSPLQQEHFQKGIKAEEKFFGKILPLPINVQYSIISRGDLNFINENLISSFLDTDIIVTYGCSFIKENLFNNLRHKKIINIHSGLLPYYKGSGAHFWAAYDESPEYIGCSVHKLSEELDSGEIIFSHTPDYQGESFHDFSMKAIFEIQQSLIGYLKGNEIFEKQQNSNEDISLDTKRLSTNKEFNDKVLEEFNSRIDSVMRKLAKF